MSDSEEDFDTHSGDSDIETEIENDSEDDSDDERDAEPPVQPWFRIFPPEEHDENQPDFAENVGPKHMPEPETSPIGYFYLFLTLGFLQQIVTETNRYAREFIANQDRIRRFSRLHSWAKIGETTLTEIKGFLAVILNMGLIRKTSISEYWNEKFPSQDTAWFKRMFSRNRFQNLLKFFHLVDNSTVPGRDDPNYCPTAKFKPFVDLFNRQAKLHYTPEQNVSIDESLIGTRGRTAMLQYIPSKSAKYGVKVWMLVEAVTGYLIHSIIYRGKNFDRTPQGSTQGSHVVNSLLSEANLLRKRYHVTCDSFFTSIPLARQLLNQWTYFTGTIRQNRNMPNMIKNPGNLNENDFKYARQGQVLLCVYRERQGRKPVRILSTKEKAMQNRNNKPKVLDFYNKHMGGVDLADMMVTHYYDDRKTLKVWKKITFNYLQRIVINAYILYCKNTSDRPIKSRLQFLQCIIEELSSDQLVTRDSRPLVPVPRRNRINVLIRKVPKPKDCCVCSDRTGFGGRHRTRTVCNRCMKGLHKDCINNHVCVEQ